MSKKIGFIVLLLLFVVITGCSQGEESTGTELEDSSGDQVENQEASADSEYPEKTIEMILTFPAGGNYDAAARILAKYAEEYLPNDQKIALTNKTGAGNTAGVTEIFNTDPDGYTIGFVQTSALTTDPHYGKVSYTHDSFQAIMKVLSVDGYMFVKDDAPWDTIDDWIEYVENNPGDFSIAVLPSTIPLLETIEQKSRLKVNPVPFDSGGEGASALLGGHVDATVGTMGLMQSHIDSGDVRPLFVTTGEGVQADVPKLSDRDINMAGDKMAGIIAPDGLSEEKLSILHDAFKQAIEDPGLIEEYEKAGLIPSYAGPEDFQDDISRTFEMDKEILETAGLID